MSLKGQIKGVNFNYLRFLWKAIADIYMLQRSAEAEQALVSAVILIGYLPEDIKKELQGDRAKIGTKVDALKRNTDPRLRFSLNFFQRYRVKSQLFRELADMELMPFMDKLCHCLDENGYYLQKQTREIIDDFGYAQLEREG